MTPARALLFLTSLVLLGALGYFGWSLVTGDGQNEVTAIGPATPEAKDEALRPAAHLEGNVATETAAVEPNRVAESAPAEAAASTEREVIPMSFVVTGRVTDEETGVGIPGAQIVAVGGSPPLSTTATDNEGNYRLVIQDEATSHLIVQPPEGWNVRDPRAPLPPVVKGGKADVPFRLILWPPPVAGDIRGVLQSEGGVWSAGDVPGPGEVVLDLISTTLPRIQRRGVITQETDGNGGHWLSFTFADVPRAEYELTISSLDHFRWAPVSTFVSPPAENLSFLRYDLDRTLPLEFRVYERASGEKLEDYEIRHLKLTASHDNGVLLHTGPLDREAFPLDAEFEWSLWADGYAPFFGDERAFQLTDGRRIANVRLSPGWGARLLVMGGQGTKYPLSGATVLLDGVAIGSTRDDGTLDAYRETPPSKVTVEYLDWTMKNDPLRPLNGRPPERRGMVMPVLLEPPN